MIVESLPEDPSFPRLGIAGDPELMREVFQTHLRPLGEEAYHVRDCRLSRVRYRRDRRCVLQYTLRLAEADTGYERIQWVTGVMYARDKAWRKWERLRSFDPGEIPDGSCSFEPFSFIPDLGMLVQLFPYDRRLPTLPLLTAGPSPELEPPLLACFGSGDWHTEAWNVEPVRYRAELGATLRFTVQARDAVITGRTEERRFYAKVYYDESGEQTHRVLQTLRSKAGGDAGFAVGRPIAYLSGLRTLLQEETPGTSLQDILLQEEDATPAVRAAAQSLAALHLSRVATPRRHRPRDEAAALERTGNLLRWACPHLKAEVEGLVGAVVAGLEEVPPAPTHLDLKLDHILLDGDRLALIDLDGFAGADPILDTANVLAHLAGMPFRFPLLRDDRRWTSVETFAGEYFGHVPSAWRDRLPLLYAGATLKVAAGFSRRQEPDWPYKVAILLEEAKDSLAGRVW